FGAVGGVGGAGGAAGAGAVGAAGGRGNRCGSGGLPGPWRVPVGRVGRRGRGRRRVRPARDLGRAGPGGAGRRRGGGELCPVLGVADGAPGGGPGRGQDLPRLLLGVGGREPLAAVFGAAFRGDGRGRRSPRRRRRGVRAAA